MTLLKGPLIKPEPDPIKFGSRKIWTVKNLILKNVDPQKRGPEKLGP